MPQLKLVDKQELPESADEKRASLAQRAIHVVRSQRIVQGRAVGRAGRTSKEPFRLERGEKIDNANFDIEAHVILTDNGFCRGRIRTTETVFLRDSRIEGDVVCKDLILKGNSCVSGNIVANRVCVLDNSRLEGDLTVSGVLKRNKQAIIDARILMKEDDDSGVDAGDGVPDIEQFERECRAS